MAWTGVINEEGVDPRALWEGERERERVGGVTRTDHTWGVAEKRCTENVTHSNPWEEIVKGPPHGAARLAPPPPSPRQWRINGRRDPGLPLDGEQCGQHFWKGAVWKPIAYGNSIPGKPTPRHPRYSRYFDQRRGKFEARNTQLELRNRSIGSVIGISFFFSISSNKNFPRGNVWTSVVGIQEIVDGIQAVSDNSD